MAIELSTFLLPKNGNTFFLLEDKYIRGGLRSCLDHADRDAITTTCRKPGMVVVTQNDTKLWLLGLDLTTWSEYVPPVTPVLISATGLAAGITAYDSSELGFIFMASDTGDMYVKNSSALGDWSSPIHLAQGPAGPAGLTYKGEWSSTTTYAAGDVVTRLGSMYTPVSGGRLGYDPVDPISGLNNWTLVVSKGGQGLPGMVSQGAWNTLTSYTQGDVTTYNGSAYVAKSAHTNQLPTNSVYWSLLVSKGDTGSVGLTGSQGIQGVAGSAGLINRGTWSSTVTYLANDVVYYIGSSYVSKTNSNVSNLPTTSTSNWGILSSQGLQGPQGIQGVQGLQGTPALIWKSVWLADTTYGVGDAVTRSGSTFISKVAFNLNKDPFIANTSWDLVASKGDIGPTGPQGITGPQGLPGMVAKGAWSASTSYLIGDVTTYNGSAYYSKTSFNVNHNPALDLVYWSILVSQGLDGAVGPQGPQGISGSTAAHAATHELGGSDPISAASVGALALTGGILTGGLVIQGPLVWNNSYATQADFPAATNVEQHGMVIHSHADGKMFFAHGGSWVALDNEGTTTPLVLPYDIPFFILGTPGASKLVGALIVARDVSLYALLSESVAKAKTPGSTVATSFDIKLNGLLVGSCNFAVAATVGTFTFTSNVKVTVGSFLELHSTATVDSTLADIGITLVGFSLAPQGTVLP